MDYPSVDNQPCPQAGPHRQKDQMLQVPTAATNAEVVLSQSPSISVVLNIYGQAWVPFRQHALQGHSVPSPQVWGVQQNPLLYPERPPH